MKRSLGISLALLVVGGIALAIAQGQLSQNTAAGRAATVRKAIAAFSASAPKRTILTGTPKAGNAAEVYASQAEALRGRQLSYRSLNMLFDALTNAQPLPKRAQAPYDELGGRMTKELMEAVRLETCDWSHDLSKGLQDPPRWIVSLRTLGALLAIKSQLTEDDSEALELALGIVAFGQDVSRTPTLLGYLFGLHIEADGYRAVLRLVDQRSFPPETLKALSNRLERAASIPPARGLESSRLEMAATLVNTEAKPATGLVVDFNREHTLLNAYYERCQEFMALPAPKRTPESKRPVMDAADEVFKRTVLVKNAVPDVKVVLEGAEETATARAALLSKLKAR